MAETEKGTKLTKTIVDKLEHIPGKTQTFYRDNDLKGFALRITSGGAMYEYQDGNGHPTLPSTQSNTYHIFGHGIEWIENKQSSNRIN